MEMSTIIEIFGYVGSVLVVVSMLMSSIVKLRIINTVGSVISCIYAVICGALPLALMNVCLIIINVISLVKLLKTKQEYEFLEGSSDESMVRFFMDCYAEDIKSYFPDFKKDGLRGKKAYIVCCSGAPAGIMVGEEKDGAFDVDFEYSTPAYRDCSLGTFLYSKLPEHSLKSLNYSRTLTEAHEGYLKKMGYKKENGTYTRTL